MAHPMVRAELFSALAKFGLSTPLGRLDNPRTPGEQYLATAPEVRVELVTCVLRAIAATAQA